MNGAVSKQSGTASQGANIIKIQTSGMGEAEKRGSRVGALSICPSVPIKNERRKEEQDGRRGKLDDF